MKTDIPTTYSVYYGNLQTPQYRREFVRWLRDNNPVALRKVLADHKLKLEDFGFVV